VRMMRGRFICAVILDLIMNAVPLLRSVSLVFYEIMQGFLTKISLNYMLSSTC